VVAIGGGVGRSLTQGKYRHSSPRWSPDGKRIAYVSDRSGKSRIHVRDFQTGEETTITDGERVPSNLSWSPNGEWIAFTAFTPVATQWMPARPSKPAGANWAPPAAATSTLRWTFDGTGVLEPGGPHFRSPGRRRHSAADQP
jgi:Tol biopolymer transport system component